MKNFAAPLLLCLFVVLFPGVSKSAETGCPTADLADIRNGYLDLGPPACVLVDVNRVWTLDDIQTDDVAQSFEPVPTGLVDFGFGDARYWVQVKLHNSGNESGEWWVTHTSRWPIN